MEIISLFKLRHFYKSPVNIQLAAIYLDMSHTLYPFFLTSDLNASALYSTLDIDKIWE